MNIFRRRKPGQRGIRIEKGELAGCTFLFPQNSRRGYSFGSSPSDGPDFLVRSRAYFYLHVGIAYIPGDYEYMIIVGEDGPLVGAHSDMLYDYGDIAFRLL